jgi:hypothetical protein
VIRKVVKPWNEVQLGFTFLVEEEASSPVVRDRETGKAQKSREVKPTPDNLRDAIALTQAQLLDAPLGDVSSRLLPLLELCEAALTRALAQWILSEKLARRGTKSEEKTTRRKRTMNDEQSSQ